MLRLMAWINDLAVKTWPDNPTVRHLRALFSKAASRVIVGVVAGLAIGSLSAIMGRGGLRESWGSIARRGKTKSTGSRSRYRAPGNRRARIRLCCGNPVTHKLVGPVFAVAELGSMAHVAVTSVVGVI